MRMIEDMKRHELKAYEHRKIAKEPRKRAEDDISRRLLEEK